MTPSAVCRIHGQAEVITGGSAFNIKSASLRMGNFSQSEIKAALARVIEQGLAQTAQYAASVGATEAHLVIFNRDNKVLWDDKIWRQQGQSQSRHITIWGC